MSDWRDQEKLKKALFTLGLPHDQRITEEALKQAYLKTMKRVHPDLGGNDYLSKQVNEAKDIIEKWLKYGPTPNYQEQTKSSSPSPPNEADQKSSNGGKNNYQAPPAKEPYPNAGKWVAGIVFIFVIIAAISDDNKPSTTVHPPVATSIPAIPTPEPVQLTDSEIEQQIAEETGILIKHITSDGRELPIEGGYVSDSAFVITYGDKEIYRDSTSAYVHLEDRYKLDNKDVVLTSFASGGNACEATYRLITVGEKDAEISSEIGNCYLPEIKQLENSLLFSFFDGYGQRKVFTYSNGKVTESSKNLPLFKDPDMQATGYKHLVKYVIDRQGLEQLIIDSRLNPAMKKLMGDRYGDFVYRLTRWQPIQDFEYIMIGGIAPHSGGSDEAFLAIAIDGSHIYAGMLSTTFIGSAANSRLELFSDKPAMFSKTPPKMLQWMANYPDAFPVWKFGK